MNEELLFNKLDSIQNSSFETAKTVIRVEGKVESVVEDVENLRNAITKVENKLVGEVEKLKEDVYELKQTNRVLKWILGVVTPITVTLATYAIKSFMGW